MLISHTVCNGFHYETCIGISPYHTAATFILFLSHIGYTATIRLPFNVLPSHVSSKRVRQTRTGTEIPSYVKVVIARIPRTLLEL